MADRETIVDTGSGGGGVLAVVLVVVVLVVAALLFLDFGQGGTKTVDVDVPKVSVGVTPDGQ